MIRIYRNLTSSFTNTGRNFLHKPSALPLIHNQFYSLSSASIQRAAYEDIDFNQTNHFIISVLGGPGVGKSTQCLKLVKEFGFTHLSLGDILRKEKDKPSSPHKDLIHQCILQGEIAPKEITFPLLQRSISASKNKKILLDGFPRNLSQAEAFESNLNSIECILYMYCPEEELLRRLLKRSESSHRLDDNLKCIKRRLKNFHKTTVPLIEYYTRSDVRKVYSISCLESEEIIYQRIYQVLKSLNIQSIQSS